MKASDMIKIMRNFPITSELGQNEVNARLQKMGYEPGAFYQELEMDSLYAETHEDISFSNSTVQLHSHTFYEILCCSNTCGAGYLLGSLRYLLEKGDIILIPPGTSHRPLMPEDMKEPYKRDVLRINPEFMERIWKITPDLLLGAKLQPQLIRTAGTRWEFLQDLFRTGVREAKAKAPGWETMVAGNTLTILSHLHRIGIDQSAKPLKAEKPELLERVMAYVESHYAQRITLSQVAQAFYVSESTITHTFQKKMRVSFYRYVTQRRLIAAKSLILQNLPMEDVAVQSGFSDYSSFYRAFKQEFGISPRQYRNLQPKPEDLLRPIW